MRSDVGRRCQPALGGGRCGVEWPLPPSPAGPREVRAGASRPPLRPAPGGAAPPARTLRAAPGTTGPLPVRPHSPLPSSFPAPGGAARRRAPRRTCRAGPSRGPPHPRTRTVPCPPRVRGLCSASPAGHPSVREGGGTLPPRSVSGDHRPAVGGPPPGPPRTLAGSPSRTAHLRPRAESLPQPRLQCSQPSSDGPLPPPHPRTPGGARAESILQRPSVPPGGWGLRLEPEW